MKIMLIAILLFVTSTATALNREVKIPNSLGYIITVEKSNGNATWHIYGSKRYESVLLFRLNLSHANILLQAADRADAFYKEINQSGKCPTSTVKSGSFGKIRKNGVMEFEVICNNNRNSLKITMHDKHVINYFTVNANPAQVRQMAQKLVKELGGEIPSVTISPPKKVGSHSHNGRVHSHAFPQEGVGHKHGNGAIGK